MSYFIVFVCMMDEVFSLDFLFADEHAPDQLYQLVRLHELSNRVKYVTKLTWYGHKKLSLLMIGARNGYDDIVRVLLTDCDRKCQIE